MYVVGLHIYCEMIHGPYNIKLKICKIILSTLSSCLIRLADLSGCDNIVRALAKSFVPQEV